MTLRESEFNLLDVSIIGPIDELLKFSKAVGFGQSKDQLCLYVGFAGLLTSHLQEFDQVLPVTCNIFTLMRLLLCFHSKPFISAAQAKLLHRLPSKTTQSM